jgi:hypothetical protein
LQQDANNVLSPARYLASVFVDARDIVATGRTIAGVLSALDDDALLPTSAQEVGPQGPVARMAFTSPDERTILMLQGGRFDYSRQSPDIDAANLGELTDFCREAATKLQVLLHHFKRVSYRLACVQETWFKTDSDIAFEQVRRRLLNLPPPYENAPTVEWDWRVNRQVSRKVGSLNELTNSITTVRRALGTHVLIQNGVIQQNEVSRIRVDIDINTTQSNPRPRFHDTHLRSFFDQAPRWHAELGEGVVNLMTSEDE